MRAADEQTSAAGRDVDAAALLGERAGALVASVKEQALHRARLADGAQSLVESGARMAKLAREQLESGRAIIEIVTRLATDTQSFTRGQKDLRRHIDRIHTGAAQLSGLESEVVERIATVSESAVALRAELQRMRSA
jgi:hypothetical protein